MLLVAIATLIGQARRPRLVAHAALLGGPRLFAVRPWEGPRWSTADRQRVARELGGILISSAFDDSGLVVIAGDGTPLFARRPTAAVTPASTLKLMVAATALARLGAEHRFVTSFVAHRPANGDGRVAGPLWLIGGGDPLFTNNDLRAGVGALFRSGVRHVDGGLIVDGNAFAGPEQNPLWDPSDLPYDYAAGASAISVDQGLVELDVTPTLLGAPAQIRVIPPNPTVRIHSTVMTVGSYEGSFVDLTRGVSPLLGGSPAYNVLDLTGHVAIGPPQKYFEPVHGLGAYVGGAASVMFAERGIQLAGTPRLGVAPPDAMPLWRHRSRPLREILRDMLVNSNNHTAEQLLRIVGEPDSSGLVLAPTPVPDARTTPLPPPGSASAGVAVERTLLADLGVSTTNLRVVDGSGLSPSDRIAATTLAELVAKMLATTAGDDYLRALPLVGLEGTVRHHQLGDALGREGSREERATSTASTAWQASSRPPIMAVSPSRSSSMDRNAMPTRSTTRKITALRTLAHS